VTQHAVRIDSNQNEAEIVNTLHNCMSCKHYEPGSYPEALDRCALLEEIVWQYNDAGISVNLWHLERVIDWARVQATGCLRWTAMQGRLL